MYRTENREFVKKLQREWRGKNRIHINNQRREYLVKKYETDPEYEKRNRLKLRMANAINHSLNGKKKGASWEKLVSYTLDDLILHLESKFQPGMSWENRGRNGWHIDHVIPIVAFDFSSPGDIDFQRCWAIDNLRPLWEWENLAKGGKIDQSLVACVSKKRRSGRSKS